MNNNLLHDTDEQKYSEIHKYNNISYNINIIVYKKYLEDNESDALLHTVLSDPIQTYKSP